MSIEEADEMAREFYEDSNMGEVFRTGYLRGNSGRLCEANSEVH
jgi:hypothetical protein